jgi:hypothetical protein
MRAKVLTINLLNLFLVVVEGFLGLRFLLKLFGASSGSGFVSWIYDMSSVLLEPFRGIFPAKVFENQYVLEFSTLFAMLMYAVLALVILAVINAVTEPTAVTTTTKKRV